MNDIPENLKTIQNVPSLNKFLPTFWLFNAFTQIIYGAKLDNKPEVSLKRETFDFPDGGTGTIDWGPIHKDYTESASLPILIILPGLTGGVTSAYIRHCILDTSSHGFRTVVYTQRGLENTQLVTNQYHGAHSLDDVANAIQHVQHKYPQSTIYGLGISIGANFITNYAARKDCLLKGFVALANPFDLVKTTDHLANQRNPLWGYFMATNQINGIKKHLDIIRTHNNYKHVDEKGLLAKQPREYDRLVSSPLFGYSSLNEYYNQNSSIFVLKDVKVPALFINSRDDPVIDVNWLPIEQIKQSNNMVMVVTNKGGHCDWFTGTSAHRWAYTPAAQYLKYIHNRNNQSINQ